MFAGIKKTGFWAVGTFLGFLRPLCGQQAPFLKGQRGHSTANFHSRMAHQEQKFAQLATLAVCPDRLADMMSWQQSFVVRLGANSI